MFWPLKYEFELSFTRIGVIEIEYYRKGIYLLIPLILRTRDRRFLCFSNFTQTWNCNYIYTYISVDLVFLIMTCEQVVFSIIDEMDCIEPKGVVVITGDSCSSIMAWLSGLCKCIIVQCNYDRLHQWYPIESYMVSMERKYSVIFALFESKMVYNFFAPTRPVHVRNKSYQWYLSELWTNICHIICVSMTEDLLSLMPECH